MYAYNNKLTVKYTL